MVKIAERLLPSYRKSMQMRMAMSICTGLKPQAGDGMGEKKERGRFTLRFNEGDPIHEAAIGLLELQSPRTKDTVCGKCSGLL